MPRSGFDFSNFARDEARRRGWREVPSDKNVYLRRDKEGRVVFLVLYVDDGAILGPHESIQTAMNELRSSFRVSKEAQLSSQSTKQDPVRYLGTNIYKEGNKWILDSTEYACHVVARAGRRRPRSGTLVRQVDILRRGVTAAFLSSSLQAMASSEQIVLHGY
ncbi:hypothetical protein FVE85_8517 [Porphyridium purpureum]|uniref:Reverse transcriptase Ty1/copia-type domain-containing protein n=1 Tax=Porphyridium purpureum TaxID=35688 RepID=A0A5J4YI11_PORPP|nr:hypothetical protein FVE85_8517 [Porphyridium purpureum]|eukprot:POR8734..scf257_31